MVWDGSAHTGFSTAKPLLPVKAPQAALNVAAQEGAPGSVPHYYRTMLAYRRAQPALRSGKTEFQETLEPVLAFRPTQGAESMTCVFDLGPGSVTPPAPAGSPIGPVLAAKTGKGALKLDPNAARLLRA